MLAVGSEPDSDCFTTFFNTTTTTTTTTTNKMKRIHSHSQSQSQRRFTDQQIKSLENIFQSESKLEPRKKLELAKDLGLQPRQVAIWFQNKRARWKSKQLERDYNRLRSSYDSLSSRFDLLNRENQSLNLQLKKLRELIEKKATRSSSSTEDENSNDNCRVEIEEKASLCVSSEKGGLGIVSDADSSIKPEYEYPLQNMLVVEQGDNWDDLQPNTLLHDESTIGGDDPSDEWWDFWC